MTYLLDVNALIAAVWEEHQHFSRMNAWLAGKKLAVCPITEMGFLRVLTNQNTLGVGMEEAMRADGANPSGSGRSKLPTSLAEPR
jgi:predicted nucleic acid-binding protein